MICAIPIVVCLDYGKYTIKKLLNHKNEDKNDVTAGYVQISDKKLRAAMNEIEEIVLGKNRNANEMYSGEK